MVDLEGWVVMARTLASLEILKPLDAQGREVDVVPDFLSGSITYVFSLGKSSVLSEADKGSPVTSHRLSVGYDRIMTGLR
jgi:hypothetical protein